MQLSSADIRFIAELVIRELGPNAGYDEVRDVVEAVVERLLGVCVNPLRVLPDSGSSFVESGKKLVINALGRNTKDPQDKLVTYLHSQSLLVLDFSANDIGSFKSIIAVIDYSQYSGDINKLKFELCKIVEDSGYKAIVQDGLYYGI